MPGGIDKNGAFAIDPQGNRVPGILTDITVRDDEGLLNVEEHNPEGLNIPRDKQTGLPDVTSLLRLGALFRGVAVVLNHGKEVNIASPLEGKRQGRGLLK